MAIPLNTSLSDFLKKIAQEAQVSTNPANTALPTTPIGPQNPQQQSQQQQQVQQQQLQNINQELTALSQQTLTFNNSIGILINEIRALNNPVLGAKLTMLMGMQTTLKDFMNKVKPIA